MQGFSKWIFKKCNWSIVGEFPGQKKYVVIVVPHTSNWDFILGLLTRSIAGIHINFIGKEMLFKAPWGWIFRGLGGYPVKRDKNHNQVDQVIKIIKQEDEFRLAIAPEGTRSDVEKWKTGFYWIASGAEIPIIMVAFDYGEKQVRISKPFYPTGNKDTDFEFMHKFYDGVKGKK
ncbi:MAG: 1-acyl-sn-glycerol-3-phosphate acyltransferase [Bacteroidota bacterium]